MSSKPKPITWTTKRIKLRELVEWSDNPVQISEKEAKELAKSIDRYEHVLPYVAAAPLNGGKGIPLLDGHQRKMVEIQIRKVSPKTLVDVRVPSRKLTEHERQELAVRLRKNVGEWDFDKLANFFDVPDLLEWGFTERELTGEGFSFGNEITDTEPQTNKADELQKKYKTKTGQLWKLGEHRLLIADCTVNENVKKLMSGKECGACVTDSPYGINREGIENDDPEGLRGLFDGVLANLPIKNGVIINFQSPRLFPVWVDAIRAMGHKVERALRFYDETDVTFPWHGWLMCSQIAIVSSVGKPKFSDSNYHHDCYLVKTAGKQDDSGGHTTAKPLDVVQDLVAHTAGDVYEPFAGSGTTIIAAQNLGRRCYAMEINEKYSAVIIQRWMDATGIKPEIIKG